MVEDTQKGLDIRPEDWPKTELERFEFLDGISGIAWLYNHDAGDGRIVSSTEMDNMLARAKVTGDQIVAELEAEIGVIPHEKCPEWKPGKEMPPAPQGKIYWWDWITKMKAERDARDWNRSICSACPFGHSDNLDVSFCHPFRGSMQLRGSKCWWEGHDEAPFAAFGGIAKAIECLHGFSARRAFEKKKDELESIASHYFFWMNLAHLLDEPRAWKVQLMDVTESAKKAGENYSDLLNTGLIDKLKAGDQASIQLALVSLKELKPSLPMNIQNWHETNEIFQGLLAAAAA